jgi:hypothetical protein
MELKSSRSFLCQSRMGYNRQMQIVKPDFTIFLWNSHIQEDLDTSLQAVWVGNVIALAGMTSFGIAGSAQRNQSFYVSTRDFILEGYSATVKRSAQATYSILTLYPLENGLWVLGP